MANAPLPAPTNAAKRAPPVDGRTRQQQWRQRVSEKQKVQAVVAMKLLACLTTPSVAGEKPSRRLKITRAQLTDATKRLGLDGLTVKGSKSMSLEAGASKCIKAVAVDRGLLGTQQTAQWLDPGVCTELRQARQQLAAEPAVKQWSRMGSGKLVMQLQQLVPDVGAVRCQRASAQPQQNVVSRPAGPARRSSTAAPTFMRHSKRHYEVVEDAWLRQAKVCSRKRLRIRVDQSQARALHRSFWLFCRKQRKIARLKEDIKRAGSWELLKASTDPDPKLHARMLADYQDLLTRKAESGAIRMRGTEKDTLFKNLYLDAVDGVHSRMVVTRLFTSWRRLAGGKALSQR